MWYASGQSVGWILQVPQLLSSLKHIALIFGFQAGWGRLWLWSSNSSFVTVMGIALEGRMWASSLYVTIQDFWRSTIHLHLFPKSIIGHYFILHDNWRKERVIKVLFCIQLTCAQFIWWICFLPHLWGTLPHTAACWQSLLYICGRKMRCCMAWK